MIEQTQLSFFKKLLYLARNTPNYLVRLETGTVKLSYQVFKLTLSWLEKLMLMDDDRLPKLCFLRQLSLLDESTDARYNWVAQVKKFFEYIDLPDVISSLDLQILRTNKHFWLQSFYDKCFQEDLDMAVRTNYPLLSYGPDHLQTCQAYLPFKAHIGLKRFIAQLRLTNNHVFRATVSNITYSFPFDEHCTICNMD